MATITDMGELRGKIFYKEHYKTRVVSHVEWLDSKHVCVRLIIIQKKDLNLLKQFTIC